MSHAQKELDPAADRTGDRQVFGSFRDPSGFLFSRAGDLYRQVNKSYREHYDLLMSSGLYDTLTARNLLVPHVETDTAPSDPENCYRVIQPEPVSMISYPFEWCFSQYRDAAMLTLRIQKLALEHGMSLKDASAYNVQFRRGEPVFIDTLSFEIYREGVPWVAYRQFCGHFLAPLALMSRRDVRLGQLLRVHLDGVPLDLAGSLLPRRSLLSFGLLLHIHLHARSQRRYASKQAPIQARRLSRISLLGLIDSLESAVRHLNWEPRGTEWGDYYNATNYSQKAQEHKESLIRDYVRSTEARTVWDLGANTGRFSRIAAEQASEVLSFDIDPSAVEQNYRACRESAETAILPLLCDLTNPSPGIGWQNRERQSLLDRGKPDAVLALALIHHLAITNNLPLRMVASLLAKMGRFLIIEFVPKEDSRVQRLLSTREDIFPAYTRESFEKCFSSRFCILRSDMLHESCRTVYLMETRET